MSTSWGIITCELSFPITLIKDNLPKGDNTHIFEMVFDHHLPKDWERVGEVYVTDDYVGALCTKQVHYA